GKDLSREAFVSRFGKMALFIKISQWDIVVVRHTPEVDIFGLLKTFFKRFLFIVPFTAPKSNITSVSKVHGHRLSIFQPVIYMKKALAAKKHRPARCTDRPMMAPHDIGIGKSAAFFR